MEGKVSIIIPVYNREKYLEECLESVLAQSYGDFEVILIDDGSTDGTLDICNKYTILDTRFNLIQGGHEGVSAARNKGLDVAQGEFIFFLDSDDVINPHLLESIVKGMEEKNADIGGTRIIGVREENWYRVREKMTESSGLAGFSYQNYEDTLHSIFFAETPLSEIGGVMFRRELIDDTRFNKELYIGEDFYFIYQNLIKGADSIFIDKKWYYCRSHEGNSSWDFNFSGFYNRYYRRQLVWESEERFGRVENANQQKRQAFGMFVRCVRKHQAYSEESKKMRRFIKKHKNVLFPAMTYKEKMKYFLFIYMPFVKKYIK